MRFNNYTRKIIISYIFLWWFSFALYYVSWLDRLVNMWFAILLYSVIFFLLYAFWKFIYWKEQTHYFLFFIIFLYRVSAFIAITVLFIGWFAVYNNEIRPAQFPLYTLSNWERTLKFQTVSHIASPSFYLTIRESIRVGWEQGFVLFFEWVRPWSEENMESFNKALGIDFSDTLYENFSQLYWVTAQNNLLFLWLWAGPDINVDMDIDTIMDLYRTKVWERSNDSWTSETLQVDDEIIRILTDLRPRELLVLQYINQAMLNFFMRQEWLQWFILERSGVDIFAVILWERDRYVANFIYESDFENIFALYWKLHFEWILQELRLLDMRWDIVDVRYKQVIERSSAELMEEYMQLQNTVRERQGELLRGVQMSGSN